MDPILSGAIMILFGLVALFSGLAFLMALVMQRRVSRRAIATGLVSVAVVIGCVMASPPGFRPAERDRVDQLHARFAPALERYRQAHGDYPPTLEAAGIATPTTMYGPLRYQRYRLDDGTRYYEISFGDYYRNGFTASFNSSRAAWSLDT